VHGAAITPGLRGAAILAGIVCLAAPAKAGSPDDWPIVNGGADSIHYSALDQINRTNAKDLQIAWSYDSGDAFPGSELECNPIVVDGTLYAVSPKQTIFALDAANGKPRWSFDPNAGQKVLGKLRSRGVTYWTDGTHPRIFAAVRHYLYALDAITGQPIQEFGKSGRVDLREGLGRDIDQTSISEPSPGIVYRDLIIFGGTGRAPGDIRAYDTRSGKLRWSFHTIPHPGELGYDTWPKEAWRRVNGANAWAGMSLDERRGILFVPTASAFANTGNDDFYGADRIGDNLFADCVIALDAATGKRIWHFEGVKHDIWDRDFPAPPSLVTIQRDGKAIDAVAQITKSGFVFLLDRATGKPLSPIVTSPAPPSDVPGEVAAKTQIHPARPAPFARQTLTADMLTQRTPEAHAAALDRFRQLRGGTPFVPPSLQGTILFPGMDGGGEWGGSAFDPETGLLYVNANEMAWILRLQKRSPADAARSVASLYRRECASCHGEDRTGHPPEYPSLVKLGDRYSDIEIVTLLFMGQGRMPGFARLGQTDLMALTEYLLRGTDAAITPGKAAATAPEGPEYVFGGYERFLDPDGFPAISPPWGTLSAINLKTGDYAWQIPFGEYPELAAKGLPHTGSENYGGAVVTAGGVLFIGATLYDRKFHAFDKTTGKLLWETTLPASGNATPAVYKAGGREFVVIAAGGGKTREPSGSRYIAFALPEPPH